MTTVCCLNGQVQTDAMHSISLPGNSHFCNTSGWLLVTNNDAIVVIDTIIVTLPTNYYYHHLPNNDNSTLFMTLLVSR